MTDQTKNRITTERERCKQDRKDRLEILEKDKATHDTDEPLRDGAAND